MQGFSLGFGLTACRLNPCEDCLKVKAWRSRQSRVWVSNFGHDRPKPTLNRAGAKAVTSVQHREFVIISRTALSTSSEPCKPPGGKAGGVLHRTAKALNSPRVCGSMFMSLASWMPPVGKAGGRVPRSRTLPWGMRIRCLIVHRLNLSS